MTRLLLTLGPKWDATRGGYPWSLQEGQVMGAVLSFGSQNFGSLKLGDSRRTDRLVQVADGMCRHPGGTLPDKFPKPADLRAVYRDLDRWGNRDFPRRTVHRNEIRP